MFVRGIYASHTLRLSQFSARAMSNPLKRPAPATRDSSSSSIQVVSPQKPKPKADVSLDEEGKDGTKPTDASVPSLKTPTSSSSTAQLKKPEDKAAEPPTKKPKIALVPGGAGSGGQTKLAFGKVGGGKTATSSSSGAGKKAVAGTGSSSGGSGGEC